MSASSALATRASEIVVGKPLPFSVFGSANKLLLARGRVVESDSMRHSLLVHGIYCDAPPNPAAEAAATLDDTAANAALLDPLLVWRARYEKSLGRHRLALQMSKDEASESFASWLIGAHEDAFVITGPEAAESARVVIEENQTWVFRAFVATTVVRFHARIRKVSRIPFSHLYVGRPERVEQRRVRGVPRAPVCLDATLGAGGGVSSLIVDLSTTGARLAVRSSVELAKGDRVRVQTTIPLLGRNYALCSECIVAANYGVFDPEQPEVISYGVRFGKTSETDELALHGFVHEQLSAAVNTLGEICAMADG